MIEEMDFKNAHLDTSLPLEKGMAELENGSSGVKLYTV